MKYSPQPQIDVEQVAEMCHEVNRAICEAQGDFSQVEWKDAPEDIKRSAIDGVEFHINNPDSKPSDSHENWMKFKEADGWVYGKYKSSAQKTHPCMRPYEELPFEQKVKDYAFHRIVKTVVKQYEEFINNA